MMTERQTLGHISPFLIVGDLVRAVRFYEERLGFEVRYSAPPEAPFFAIVGRDQVQIYLKAVSETVGAFRITCATSSRPGMPSCSSTIPMRSVWSSKRGE